VAGTEDTTWHFWPLLWQRGGEILTPDNAKVAFNGPQGVEALEFLRGMAVDDKSVYLDQTDEKYGPLFADGRVGMIISGPWQLYDLVQKGTPYGVAPIPGTNGNHTTVSGADIWTLFDHRDANRAYWSFELMKWLTSTDIDARWNLEQGNLPLRSTAKGTAAYAEYVKQYPGVDVLFDGLATSTRARPSVAAYPEVSRYIGTAISEALQGATPPKAALDKAAQQSDPALAGR
jgi:multiple sugar transport system substrate-binding protein